MRKSIMALIFSLFIISLAGNLFSQTSQLLNYQGKLTNKDGTAAPGTYSIIFSIYAVQSGGTALWFEPQDVPVINGVFNVLLGNAPHIFPDTLFTGNGNRYLGIKVGTDPEMQPRFQLTSVPFAIHALSVADINGTYTASLNVTEGSNPTILPNSYELSYHRIGSLVFVSMPCITLTISGNPKVLDFSLPFPPAVADQGGNGSVTHLGGISAGVVVKNAMHFREFGNGYISGPFRGGFWYIASK